MKTTLSKIICLVILTFLPILNLRSQDKLSQSIASIKAKVQDVQIDKTTFRQSIEVLDEGKGKLNFVSEVVDDKGKTSKDKYEFYVSDIDKNTIQRKTSGKKLFISLSVSDNQKFIKHFREDKLDSYTNNMEILLSGADAAQELADLFRNTIPLVNSGEKGWNTNTDALNWLKSNISKTISGPPALEQSFSFGERKDYLATFTVKQTDQKSVSTEEKYEFNVMDINKKNLAVKISGTQLSVVVETKGNDPYIRYTKNNEAQGFENDFEIVAEDIEQARNIKSAISVAIDKSKAVVPDFGSLQKALDFIAKNTSEVTLEKKSVNQKINFTPGDGTKSTFIATGSDSKGKAIEEKYEFYLSDIDANSMAFKVSGQKITIIATSVNKTKFIRYSKDNLLQDFQNEVDILTTDIETSREMLEAFKAAIKGSATQPPFWKNTGDAVAYLSGAMTGETAGSDKYKLNFSTISTEPLNIKYIVNKTDAKGMTSEQAFEFYPYMLDPSTVKIGSSGKYLNVEGSSSGKKPYIKVFKDGRQQSYDDMIEIMAFDARQAQTIAEAIKYIAVNGKPVAKTWNDKQSAMKFIVENTGDLKYDENEIKQKIELTGNDPCKVTYTVSRIEDKGKTTEEIFEFALTDMNKSAVDTKVSGKNVEVTLSCKNKEKLVKAYKNGTQQAWGTSVAIEANDVETAKNIGEAFKSAISMCEK